MVYSFRFERTERESKKKKEKKKERASFLILIIGGEEIVILIIRARLIQGPSQAQLAIKKNNRNRTKKHRRWREHRNR